MDTSQNQELIEDLYRELFEVIIPFWVKYSHDDKNGGFYDCLDIDGKVYDTKKYLWLQGRQVFIYARLCNLFSAEEIEKRSKGVFTREVLKQAAIRGNKFNLDHGFTKDEHQLAYFAVSETGEPKVFQRKIFSATFIIMGCAEVAKLTQDKELRKKALEIFWRKKSWVDNPKIFNRQLQGNGSALNVPMIMLNTIQELRSTNWENEPMTDFDALEDQYAIQLQKHIHPILNVFLENVGPNGELSNDCEGRLFNPGHSIEAAWFLLQYGVDRKSDDLIQKALQITDKTFQWGWDKQKQGMIYFIDIAGYDATQLEAKMKLWWPQTECMVALAYAYKYAQVEKKGEYLEQFKMVWEYCKKYFSDPKNGEWFGYLDNDNKVTHRFKGGPYKTCFHMQQYLKNHSARSLYLSAQLLK